MIVTDQYGVPLVVTNESDIMEIEQCMALILGMKENTVFIKKDSEEEYTFCLSLMQIFCAELFFSMEKNKHSEACNILNIVERLAAGEKENRAIAINHGLIALRDGNYTSARNYFLELLIQNPKDIFAFYATHMIEFNNGMTHSMLETLHSVNEHWQTHDLFYGYCKGIESFILNENGFYKESRQCGEEAINLNPDDIYAIHALCHHFYDNHAYHEGKLFMDKLADKWQNSYGMRLHLYWHYALFLMKSDGRHLLYDVYQSLREKNNIHSLEDLDATSFLFRLSLCDDDELFRSEAQKLLENWHDFNELGFYFFNDFHASLIFSLSERVDLIDYLILQSANSRPAGYSKTKVTLLQAIKYHTLNEHHKVISLLSKPLDFRFMGGSKAQRSIIAELLTYAKSKTEMICGY